MRRWLRYFSLIAVLGVALGIGFHGTTGVADAEPLKVITPSGEIVFEVEIADTPAERSRGLMRREELAENAGMLFIFEAEGKRSFWMKDTPLPLDIIFFDGDGEYVSHHTGAVPYSLDSIPSDGPAQYVLEINAGLAEALGIDQASRILLP
jgi:uncharacterized membrane protein (UPF0127 family)